MMTSHSKASDAPSPVAWPLSRQMSGLSRSSWPNTISFAWRAVSSNKAGSSIAACIQSMSPPGAAGQDHDVRFSIVPDVGEDAGELGVQLGIHRIERVRPVEREHEDAPAALDGNGPIRLIAGHGALP